MLKGLQAVLCLEAHGPRPRDLSLVTSSTPALGSSKRAGSRWALLMWIVAFGGRTLFLYPIEQSTLCCFFRRELFSDSEAL